MSYPSKDQRNKELVKKIESGWSYSKVGEHFNISKPTAHETFKRWSPIYGKERKGLSTEKSEKDLTSVRA